MRLLLMYLAITALTCVGVLHWLEADELLPAPMRYATWGELLDFPSAAEGVKTSATTRTEGER